VQRIAAGLLRILFPSLETVTVEQFAECCAEPAKELRRSIRQQLALMDEGYSPSLAMIEPRWHPSAPGGPGRRPPKTGP